MLNNNMKRALSITSLFIVSAFIFAGLGEVTFAQKKDAPKGKSANAADLYKQHCARCHGADGKGLESLETPDFGNPKWQAEHTDAKIRGYIVNGEGIMPAYKSILTPAQITSLVKQIRSYAPKAAPKKK